jgi:hypothetical protein
VTTLRHEMAVTMGRPALRKKGAFTAAKRQRRRRRRLKREQRETFFEAKRLENRRKYQQEVWREAERKAGRDPDPWVSALPMPKLPPADELARQIADVAQTEGIPIDDLRDALERCFGARNTDGPPAARTDFSAISRVPAD